MIAKPASRGVRGRVLVAVSVCMALVATSSGVAWGYDRSQGEVLPRGTVIAGHDVGGLRSQAAVDLLHQRVVAPLHVSLVVKVADTVRTTTPWELGLRWDPQAAVAEVFDRLAAKSLAERIWVRLAGRGRSVETSPTLDSGMLESYLSTVAGEVERDPSDARMEVVDGWVLVVEAQPGYRLDVDGAAEQVVAGLDAGLRYVEVGVEVIPPAVSEETFAQVILVQRAQRKLHLYLNGEIARTYPIAVGKPGHATPSGTYEVTLKRRNPSWGNPGSAWARDMPRYIPPGPRNPLGTRALNISAPGIRIHGTSDVRSIGRAASHGCVRMLRADVEELFETVDVGTPVVIV